MSKISSPKISVILPVYNAEKYICECLDSIIGQTFQDFEVIAINDASTDNSLSILERYASKDKRIKIFSNPSNKKLAITLNKGIELSSAPLIARMDADDISLPRRFELQYKFMTFHPEVSLCGTAMQILGKNYIWQAPESDEMIRSTLIFNSPIFHPTVMYRASIIRKHLGYNTNIIYAQDYELWNRLSKDKDVIFANINTPLLLYRLTDSEKPTSYKVIQRETASLIRKEQLELLGLHPTEKQLTLHNSISSYQNINSLPDLIAVYNWLKYLTRIQNSSQTFIDICWKYWKETCWLSSSKIFSYLLYIILPSSKDKSKIITNKIQNILQSYFK